MCIYIKSISYGIRLEVFFYGLIRSKRFSASANLYHCLVSGCLSESIIEMVKLVTLIGEYSVWLYSSPYKYKSSRAPALNFMD